MWYTDAINEITQYFVDLEYNKLLAQAVTMIQDLALQQEKIEKAEQKKKMEATDGKPSDTE